MALNQVYRVVAYHLALPLLLLLLAVGWKPGKVGMVRAPKFKVTFEEGYWSTGLLCDTCKGYGCDKVGAVTGCGMKGNVDC